MLTLDETVSRLRALEEKTEIVAIDRVTGESIEVCGPKYLFRGEGRVYPDIRPRAYRFLASTCMTKKAKTDIQRIMRKIHRRLRDSEGFLARSLPREVIVEALLQHYELPTYFIDLTSSVEVAAHFALQDRQPGASGRIMAYRVDWLKRQAIIVDLAEIHWAIRPHRQNAYVVFVGQHGDLQRFRGQEYRFIASESDIKRYDQHNKLVGDPSRDPTSGFLHLVADYDADDRYSTEAIEWLNQRIPWAAMPTRIVSTWPNGCPKKVEPDFDQFGVHHEGGFSEPL